MTRKLGRLLPLFIVLLVSLIGFGILYISKDSFDTAALQNMAALLVLVLISYSIILFASFGDEYLFLIVSMIFAIGIISLFRLDEKAAHNQVLFFYVGMAGFFAVYTVYRHLSIWNDPKMIKIYVAFSAFLFVVTLVFGRATNGSTNWIALGPISIQPSEIIKVLFILALSALYTNFDIRSSSKARRRDRISQKRQLITMEVAYMHIGFLILQREWGSALLYFLIYFTLQYVFGNGIVYLIINTLFAAGGGFIGIRVMSHIQERIEIWKDPFASQQNMGYQIVQSLYAMASGGITGTGLTLGHPKNIPLVQNDFIFAAICEEFGMVGGVAVIMLFMLLVYRGIRISLRATRPFNKAVSLGISAMFGYQTFIIIGGVTKFIPLTGITLPFISAGGSSLASCFVALAILQAISSKEGELSDVI